MSIFNSMSSFSLEKFEDNNKQYQNAMFANGLWQRRKTDLGFFTLKVENVDGKKYGLTKECHNAFEPLLPKIPISIFNIILEHYRDVYKTMKSEVYTQVFWNKEKQDYEIWVPKQTVSGAQVNFENDPTKLNDFNLVLALDLHSHNTMGAFFSTQDSKDSIRCTQYAVLGKILNDTPDTYFTFGANGQHVKVGLEDIFDVNVQKLHEHSDYTIPAELVANITERKYAPPAITTKTYSGYSGACTHRSNAYLYEGYYGQYDNATGVNKTKTALTTAINSFSSMYYLNTSKLKDLFVAFVAFVEEEALTQHLSTSFDIQAFENLVAQDIPMELDASLDYLFAEVQKEYDVVKGFKTKKTKNALVVSGSNTVDNITDVSTVDVVTETISEDVTTYNDTQKQAYEDGFEAAQLNITLVEALHWYSYTDSLAQCFKVGYEKAVKDYGLNPSTYEEI